MVQPCRVYFQTHTESTDRDIFSTSQEKTDSKLTLAYQLLAITLRTTIIIIIKIKIFFLFFKRVVTIKTHIYIYIDHFWTKTLHVLLVSSPRNRDGVLSRAEYAKRIELPDGKTQAES